MITGLIEGRQVVKFESSPNGNEEISMFIEVVKVTPHEDYTVEVLFSDGKRVIYDAKPLVGKGVFAAFGDKEFFMSRCTVLNHTLAWDVTGDGDTKKCLDIDPVTLYETK